MLHTIKSLLSLTAHWISESFKKSSAVLNVTALEGSHTKVVMTTDQLMCVALGVA